MDIDSEEEINIDGFLSAEEMEKVIQDLEQEDDENATLLTDICHYSDVSSVSNDGHEDDEGGKTCSFNLPMSVPTPDSHPIEIGKSYCSGNVSSSRCIPLLQYGSGIDKEDGEQEEEEEVEEEEVDYPYEGRTDLPLNVFNFPDDFFHLELRKTKSFKHKQHEIVNEQSYTATLRPNAIHTEQATLEHIQPQLYLLFHSLLAEINEHYDSYDLVRVFITHEEMVNTNIIVGPDYLGNMSADTIMNQVADVIHSNNFIPADGQLSINIAAIRNIQGLKMVKCITDVWKDIIGKKTIISIQNDDELCLPRAIAVAVARVNHFNHPEDKLLKRKYNAMRQKDRHNYRSYSRSSLQKSTALQYQAKAGLPLYSKGTLEQIPAYECALQIGITVIAARAGNKKVYGGNKSHDIQIALYHIMSNEGKEGHFSVITSMTGMLGRSYYCNRCDKGFNNNQQHVCENWCNICGKPGCNEDDTSVECNQCHAPCRSLECLQTHRIASGFHPSKCDQMYFCPYCKVCLKRGTRRGRSPEEHMCGESFCKNCKVYYVNEDHRCYMRSTPSCAEESYSRRRFIFYDIESLIDDGENAEQIPNLIIAHSICETCCEITMVSPRDRCQDCGSRCERCDGRDRSTFKRPPCQTCGYREMIFQGPTCVTQFGQWLFSPQHQNVIAIAHNARAYDAYFLYNYIINNSMTPEIVFRGTKIMSCRVHSGLNITLLDSLNFLTMPLADLPKSFGLKEMKKGFFPHLYHTREHLNDPQCLNLTHHPSPDYYGVDCMKKDKRDEFMKWYSTVAREPFDFWKEITEYCRSDVNILLNACWKFRSLVLESTGPEHPVDPFQFMTIASVCMGIFRTKFLPETWKVLKLEDANPGCVHEWNCKCKWTEASKPHADSPLVWNNGISIQDGETVKEKFVSSPIGLLPPHGYARSDNFSVQAMKWLRFMEKEYGKYYGHPIEIQTAYHTMGEKCVPYVLPTGKVLYYKLDGYYLDTYGQNHAFEFHGCWYHGCPSCYPRDRDGIHILDKSLNQRYRETLLKESRLKEVGFTVHSVWSCQWERRLKCYSDEKKLVEEMTIHEPISVRDAYFGGRTNCIVLHKTLDHLEKAGYVDFCSLYPYVLKYMKYPVGHPTRITSRFKSLEISPCDRSCSKLPCSGHHIKFPYFGIAKVKVLPPRKLLFPVLPIKCNGKLMFPLCRTCAEAESNKRCTCTDEERMLYHTWCTFELEVALNAGYMLVEIFEVLHWENSSAIDNSTGKGGLFTEYINTFLKLKTQASGYPSCVRTWDEKMDYVREYALHEGIDLDPTLIEFNPGLRSLAKLALNSFYGKFGQRTNMKKSVFIREPHILYQILSDSSKKIYDMHVMNEDILLLEYTVAEEFQRIDRKTNVVISALCSAYARVKLWGILNALGSRVLYHDTDSVIYTYTPDTPHPETGNYLGDLTNELTCKDVGCDGCERGHWIVEFVGCGAKNYAYRVNTGQVTCKVRGFCLNYAASKIVNLESMRKVLYEWIYQTKNNGESTEQQRTPPLTTYKTMISRNKYSGVVYTHLMPKTYGMVYNKRTVSPNLTTLPYGY